MSAYLLFARSGVCIHPELLCDGHPQCQFAEDEDFERCYLGEDRLWLDRNVVSGFATHKCSSAMYPGINLTSNHLSS